VALTVPVRLLSLENAGSCFNRWLRCVPECETALYFIVACVFLRVKPRFVAVNARILAANARIVAAARAVTSDDARCQPSRALRSTCAAPSLREAFCAAASTSRQMRVRSCAFRIAVGTAPLMTPTALARASRTTAPAEEETLSVLFVADRITGTADASQLGPVTPSFARSGAAAGFPPATC